jgi:hypothetical protein
LNKISSSRHEINSLFTVYSILQWKIPKIKVIITGVTGMVGEGVMHEALASPFVSEVLAISLVPRQALFIQN